MESMIVLAQPENKTQNTGAMLEKLMSLACTSILNIFETRNYKWLKLAFAIKLTKKRIRYFIIFFILHFHNIAGI